MTADEITDTARLAEMCRSFMKGTQRLYDGERKSNLKGDMWLFELWHHLNDCAKALDAPPSVPMPRISTANAPFHPPPEPD